MHTAQIQLSNARHVSEASSVCPVCTDIQLEVWNDEIIVSLPGTNYAVTYYKPANSPQLLAKNFPCEDDGRAEPTQAEFLASLAPSE